MQVPMAHWALCMVLLLAGLPGAEPQPTYPNFRGRHMDHPQTVLPLESYCNTLIARRHINRAGQPCRSTNTFVHDPVGYVVAACKQPPDNEGIHTTPTRLSITICNLRGRKNQPPCRYAGQQHQHFVRVNCRNGLPVHLNGTHP